MIRIVKWLSIGFLVTTFSCAALWAQATAQISGTVKGQTGAVLPGAKVTVTQTDTGVTRDTLTGQTGSYVLPMLPVGPYRLEVALPGFQTSVQTGIVLQVDSNPVINAVLEVGQASAQVQVQANAAMVETRDPSVGQVIENTQILELPYGRNVNSLIVLTGAAVQTGASFFGVPILDVSGGLGFASAYSLDGAMHVDAYTGQSLPLPFPDAVQELKVETSGLPAQHGQGTAVHSVTKSGTNALHGDAFEFVRNDRFNARNYFALRRDSLKRNQFGGTLGGPIMKNKLFFFGGYQRTTLRQDAADRRQFVPTAAMRAGDFTAFASPACTAGQQITLRTPFVNNRVDPALYSKAALNIASKLPQTDDPCGRIVYGSRTIANDGQGVGAIDYQWSDKHSLFGRYIATTNESPDPFTLTPDNLLTAGLGSDSLAQAFTVGDIYRIGPDMVNAFHLAVNRVAVSRTGARLFGPTDVGINAYSYVPTALALSVSGGFALAGGTDSTFRTTTYQTNDDVSLVRGPHQMFFGANIAQSRSNTNLSAAPGFVFNGFNTGLGMADFFLGMPSTFTVASPNALYMRQWYVGLYGQDTWKLTPRLTVNYGVRWEPFFPPVSANGRVYNFDIDRFRQGIKSSVFKNAPAGFYYPGDAGFPGKSGINKQWLNFGPRFGLAWDVQGDARTSVRASYGLSYNYLPLQWRIGAGRAAPWVLQTILNSPGLDDPWRNYPGGDPFPLKFDQNALFPFAGSYETTPYNIHTTEVSSWNLSIQRQIGSDWLASASYIGSQVVHMWVQKPLNPAVYISGGPCVLNGINYNPCSTIANTNLRRRLNLERPQDGQSIGILDEFDDGGTQSYNGLLLSVQRRASRGVTVSGNYTWSHCIGDNGDTNGTGPSAGSSFLDPNNRALDRGNCDSDRRHILNLTAVAETPQFANPTVRALATGWRASGIYRKSSGSYLTILTGSDRALNGIGGQRPNQLLADVYLNKSARPLTFYLNPAAFELPPFGTLGTIGRANVRGPGSWQFDAALSREFRFRETQKLEFRAEAYNILNSFRPGNPVTTLNLVSFGRITTALDPRIMQFALRYVF